MRATVPFVGYGYEVGEPLLSVDTTLFSYGYNIGISGTGGVGDALGNYGEVRANQVRMPSEMVALAERGANGMEQLWAGGASYTPITDLARHHFGGANVLFCDGHVQWYRPEEIQCSTDRETIIHQRNWRRDYGTDWSPFR